MHNRPEHQMPRVLLATRPRNRSIAEEVASWLPAVQPPHLTDRQWDVLSRLANGQPAHQIAAELGLSRQRIYQIVTNVRRKLAGEPSPGLTRARGCIARRIPRSTSIPVSIASLEGNF